MSESARTRLFRRKVRWRIKTALTKIRRCELEFGYGNTSEMRYSRGRLRGAQTLLRKARAELLGLDNPGPATRHLVDYVEALLLAVADALVEMDATITESEIEQS